jgi:chromosome partitioning protein
MVWAHAEGFSGYGAYQPISISGENQMIISLVNQKGGVGKTTVAVNMASGLAEAEHRILIIDSDPQGSVIQWQSIADRNEFDVLHLPSPQLKKEIKSLRRRYDHIVIDSPPAIEDITRTVIEVTNLALIPIAPSPLDIWSSQETIELVNTLGKRFRKLEAKILIYRKIPGTRLGKEAREAMQSYNLDILSSEISQRIVFVESMIAGLSVLQFAPKSVAADEIRNLCKEVV